jgi:hypothetical protein
MSATSNKTGQSWVLLERLRAGVFLSGNDGLAHRDFLRWGFWIGSAIIATPIAFLCYAIGQRPEQYPQFIAGAITWRAGSKSQDYYLLLGAIFGFLAAFLILLLLAGRIRKRIASSAIADFHALIVFASLPAILWFGRLFLTKTPSPSLAGLSVLLVGLVLLFAMVATLKDITFEDPTHFSDIVSSSVLIAVWSVLGGTAFVLAVSRLGIAFNHGSLGSDAGFIRNSILASTAIGVAILVWAWFPRVTTAEPLRSRLRLLLVLSQCISPWFFLILLSTPWIQEGRRFYGYSMKPAGWIAIGLLILIAYIDLWRRWDFKPSSTESHTTSALSPVCLVGLLLYIKLDIVGLPILPGDDFHFGNLLLPWWSWSVHNMIPFWDEAPTRGLVNYVQGVLSSTLFDGSPAAFGPASPFAATGYLLFCYWVVARSIGVFAAFMAFLLMPLDLGLGVINMVMTATLCILCELYFTVAPSRWLTAWIGMGILAVLFAAAQGGLLIVATVPLGLLATLNALRHERTRLLKYLGVLAVALAVLSVLSPLGKMLIGAIHYVLDQSRIDSVAHGIEWAQGWNPAGSIINQVLWESARASWIVVAIMAGVIVIVSVIAPASERRKRLLVFAIPIFILMVLFVFRAAGRIDAGVMSRLGTASKWALSLLLPILLIAAYGKRHRAIVFGICFFLAAIINHDFTPFDVKGLLLRASDVLPAPVGVVKGNDLGLPNLGDVIVDPGRLKRLQTIKRVLNIVVEPGETYLDLTNRSAEYFYLGYRPAIESERVYNLVSEDQQLRAVKNFENTPPPIVLAGPDVILADGGTSAYRSHLLYRYLLARYVPVSVEGMIYMVRPDRLSRLAGYGDAQNLFDDGARLLLLDAVFRMKSIDELPVAWGRSLATLSPQLRQVQTIGPDLPLLLNSVKDIGGGQYQIVGPAPSLTFDISRWNFNGREAGILTFAFSCGNSNKKPLVEVFWGAPATGPKEPTVVRLVAENGDLVVPLDAAPRWLLAKEISSLGFAIADPAQCPEFSITNIQLWQRTSVDKLPK